MATNEAGDDTIATVFQAAPGTTLLYDQRNTKGATSEHLQHLQHVKHGDSNLLLVPQPSLTDRNDPLLWPVWKKWLVLLMGSFYAFMGSVTGPIMSAGMVGLAKKFDCTLQRITYANGATLICQGVFTTLWMPFAVKYGRRPVYLLSNLLMAVACLWCGFGAKTSYGALISGRAFLGVFEAPIESIVPSTIIDLVRSYRLGVFSQPANVLDSSSCTNAEQKSQSMRSLCLVEMSLALCFPL